MRTARPTWQNARSETGKWLSKSSAAHQRAPGAERAAALPPPVTAPSVFLGRLASLALVLLPAVFCLSAPARAVAQLKNAEIAYSQVVNRAPVTHAGATVGQVLDRLALLEKRQEKKEERQALESILEPFLEPYAFLLEDALESVDAKKVRPTLLEVADLFPEGKSQPAWADFLRSRRYYVLSDGQGYVRMFLPGKAAEGAYKAHYPVVRHVLTWLLQSASGEAGLDVDVYAYENSFPSQTLMLNLSPFNLKIKEALPPPAGTTPVPLKGMDDFLKKGLTIEGANINDKKELILIGTEPKRKPTLEGQPLSLADLAVAYRAVFHAGRSPAYMSLDPSPYPEEAAVNYGGRLQDTRIGWVTLRADMRFKTITDGFDPITREDRTPSILKEFAELFDASPERVFPTKRQAPAFRIHTLLVLPRQYFGCFQ